MTWRHDYGLMEDKEQKSLFNRMAQIFDNDIAKECIMQHEVDNYEEQLETLEDQINNFESRTCESCKYYDDNYCTNQKVDEMMDEFQQLDNYIRVDKGFGCNKHE